MNFLKRGDLFKQKAYLLISSKYTGNKKKERVFYGSWAGLIISIVMVIILISYLCSLLVMMLNGQKDTLNEYTMLNPFDDQTHEFHMYDSNIMPNIGFIIRGSYEQSFEERM